MARPKQFDPEVAVGRAVEVFWTRGLGGTTPQDLVDALGLGKGSLYNAFGSKHELFLRALQRYADEQAAGLTDFLAGPGPVRPRLREALERLIEMNLGAAGARGCLAVNSAAEVGLADEQTAAHVQRMFARSEAAFEAAIREGQRRGELDAAGDPAAIASLFFTATVGMQVLVKSSADTARLHRVVDALMTTI